MKKRAEIFASGRISRLLLSTGASIPFLLIALKRTDDFANPFGQLNSGKAHDATSLCFVL